MHKTFFYTNKEKTIAKLTKNQWTSYLTSKLSNLLQLSPIVDQPSAVYW